MSVGQYASILKELQTRLLDFVHTLNDTITSLQSQQRSLEDASIKLSSEISTHDTPEKKDDPAEQEKLQHSENLAKQIQNQMLQCGNELKIQVCSS